MKFPALKTFVSVTACLTLSAPLAVAITLLSLMFASPGFASTMNEVQKLLPSELVTYGEFGWSVAIDGDTAIVGVRMESVAIPSGSAYVYAQNNGVWTLEQRLTPADSAFGDLFGYSVAVDTDTVVIGAPNDEDQTAGSAYVYVRSAGVWTLQQKLVPPDGASGDFFGSTVAIDGTTAVIGARDDDDNGNASGSAYVYRRAVGVWALEQKLVPADGAPSDFFGYSASIDGDTAVIGAYLDDDNGMSSGSAYVYRRSAAVWTLEQKLLAADGTPSDSFGLTVAIDGNTAVIGAPGDDDNGDSSGSAYVYTRMAGVWNLQQKLLATDGTSNDRFGRSVAIDGDTAAIGSWFDDDQGSQSGSVYAYSRSAEVWIESVKLLASDGSDVDGLGWSVGISNSTVLAGAPFDEDEDCPEAQSDPVENYDCGAAYVFESSSFIDVTIDIRPGSDRNPINLKSNGIIPVAILTTNKFDATQVNWQTVRFGPSGATERHQRVHVKDTDYDGDMDVVLHFKTRHTGIFCSDTEATLTGETFSGAEFTGSDVIEIVKCPKNKNKKKKRS